MSEIVEITGSKNGNNAKWHPYIGEELYALIKKKGFVDASNNITPIGNRIIDETYRIFRCVVTQMKK